MSTVHQPPEGEPLACVKGAPELVLERCTHWERNGQREALTNEIRRQILDANDRMAKSALRVLGLACRPVQNPSSEYTPDSLETDLTFLGLAGMIDPPREEVKKAIRDCHASGIRTVMVTGDHKLTAAAIARQLRLGGPGHAGSELTTISGAQLEIAGNYRLFSGPPANIPTNISKVNSRQGRISTWCSLPGAGKTLENLVIALGFFSIRRG